MYSVLNKKEGGGASPEATPNLLIQSGQTSDPTRGAGAVSAIKKKKTKAGAGALSIKSNSSFNDDMLRSLR